MRNTARFKHVKASLHGGCRYILASPCLPCWQQHRGESDWLAFRLTVSSNSNKASGHSSSSINRPRQNYHRNKCTPISSSAGQLLGMRTRLCLFPTNSSFFCCCFVALLRRAAVEPSGSSWIGWGFDDVTAEPSITRKCIAITVTLGFSALPQYSDVI